MRASTIELILDFTATALIDLALTAPLGVLAAAAGGWMVGPDAAGRALVTWSSLRMMTFLTALVVAIAALLAKGVAGRGRISIMLTAIGCCLAAVFFAGPIFSHVHAETMPSATAVLPVVGLLLEAGLLVMCAWQLASARPKGAG